MNAVPSRGPGFKRSETFCGCRAEPCRRAERKASGLRPDTPPKGFALRNALRSAVCTLLILLQAGAATAQVRSVEVRVSRAFGYFLGDVVRAQAEIAVDPDFTLQRASLPVPGPLTYWLDLRDIAVEESPGRVRLHLTYQNFYAALDARQVAIPGFSVSLESAAAGGTTSARAEIPGWSLGVSPLREVQPDKRDDPAEYLQPDGRVPRLDPLPALWAAVAFLGAAILALAALGYDRGWFARKGRPFARAVRALRRLPAPLPAPLPGTGDRAGGYCAALRLIHRGLDETDGRRVLADDLAAFLDRHPAFRREGPALARFFDASRRAFFGREVEAARASLPWSEVEAGLRRLAAAEREA